jgi:glycosyltransferase involved in cell wall biosynthesis
VAGITPLVSILINNYNYGHFVGEAIDSALEQSYPSVEVVVTDDGSTDDSRAVIEGYGNRVKTVFKANGGQASAFNAGFAACSGDPICLLDADDRFRVDKAEQLVTIFETHPDVGWCFHRVERHRGDTDESERGSRQRGSGRRDLRRWLRLGWMPFAPPPTSGLCFRRSLLDRILPMPELSGITVSDNYLKVVAAALAPGFFLDEPLTTMLVHGGNLSHAEIEQARLQSYRFVALAQHLRQAHPTLRVFADRRFAKGLNRFRKLNPRPADLERQIDRYRGESTAAERVVIELIARLVPYRQGR